MILGSFWKKNNPADSEVKLCSFLMQLCQMEEGNLNAKLYSLCKE